VRSRTARDKAKQERQSVASRSCRAASRRTTKRSGQFTVWLSGLALRKAKLAESGFVSLSVAQRCWPPRSKAGEAKLPDAMLDWVGQRWRRLAAISGMKRRVTKQAADCYV